MEVNTLEELVDMLLDVQLVIKLRDMGLIETYKKVMSMDPKDIDRLSRSYWSFDIVDLFDIERKLIERYYELFDISELTKQRKS